MVCWGSWANTFKVTKKWRYELFYFDYAFGMLLAALVGAKDRGIRVLFQFDPAIDLVLADRVQIQQVLVNLFRNALEAMAVSTHRELIASNTRAADDMVEIAVADTGPGFADNALANLFQPFFTTKETGMGVGLSISRSIIEAHSGRLWAEPNEGRGVRFAFTLPIPEGSSS